MELEVAVLSIGVINIQTGKGQYDWSIYDHPGKVSMFLTKDNFLLYGAPDSLKVGDKLVLRNNDTNRKVASTVVKAVLSNDKDTLIKELLEHEFDYRKLRAFAKKRFSNKLRTSFSIKGVKAI